MDQKEKKVSDIVDAISEFTKGICAQIFSFLKKIEGEEKK